MSIPLIDKLPLLSEVEEDYGLIVDALFGFSFRPPVRENFVNVLNLMKHTKVPIVR